MMKGEEGRTYEGRRNGSVSAEEDKVRSDLVEGGAVVARHCTEIGCESRCSPIAHVSVERRERRGREVRSEERGRVTEMGRRTLWY